jgi:hypothetical protein
MCSCFHAPISFMLMCHVFMFHKLHVHVSIVSCFHASCFMCFNISFTASCSCFHASCFMFHASMLHLFMSCFIVYSFTLLSCFMFHVSMSCFMLHSSLFISLMLHAVICHVSCFMLPYFMFMFHVSCFMFPYYAHASCSIHVPFARCLCFISSSLFIVDVSCLHSHVFMFPCFILHVSCVIIQ